MQLELPFSLSSTNAVVVWVLPSLLHTIYCLWSSRNGYLKVQTSCVNLLLKIHHTQNPSIIPEPPVYDMTPPLPALTSRHVFPPIFSLWVFQGKGPFGLSNMPDSTLEELCKLSLPSGMLIPLYLLIFQSITTFFLPFAPSLQNTSFMRKLCFVHCSTNVSLMPGSEPAT